MKRRALLQATASAALGTTCSTPVPQGRLVSPQRRFAIPEISWDHIIRTVVGLRPYRPSGFRVETERLREKIVIHNYGHGARGVGLSWGTSHFAVEEALKTDQRRCAVAGCGAVGLATGRLLQRRGFDVTIYAKDLPPHTTSNVAEAQFDPEVMPDDFEDVMSKSLAAQIRARYVRAARLSHRYFQDMIGDSYGIRQLDNYRRDNAERRREREGNELGDLYHYKVLKPGEHPFGSLDVVRDTTMQIQTPIYLSAVLRDFRVAGGRIVVCEFSDLGALLKLPEPIIMNCTGLGTRALFGDEELTPDKGQITILLPQPEIDYGGFMMSPREDGLLLHSGRQDERGVWSLEPNEEVIERTMNRAIEFWGRFA